MTTLEVFVKSSAHHQLLRKIVKLLPDKAYMHFMDEDDSVVIRLAEREAVTITCRYLKKHGLRHKHYAYPFGKGFGEAKRSVVYRYFAYFLATFQDNSALALTRKKKDDFRIFERATHTMINQFGYNWLQETRIHLLLARGRIGVIKRYESHSLASELVCSFLMWFISVAMKLLILLK